MTRRSFTFFFFLGKFHVLYNYLIRLLVVVYDFIVEIQPSSQKIMTGHVWERKCGAGPLFHLGGKLNINFFFI